MHLKLNNKGIVLIEYIIILSFIGAIAIASVGDKGFVGMVGVAANKASNSIMKALGLAQFDEGVLKDALADLLNKPDKTVSGDYGGNHASLGTLFATDKFKTDELYQLSVEKSQEFENNYLSSIDFGDVPLESWRYINESVLNEQYAYLIWSDTNWKTIGFDVNPTNRVVCMYARVDKETKEVSYGVAHINPLLIDEIDGRMNKWDGAGSTIVNIKDSTPDNLAYGYVWGGSNKPTYNAPDSPYFTPDYSTAVNIYKALQEQANS